MRGFTNSDDAPHDSFKSKGTTGPLCAATGNFRLPRCGIALAVAAVLTTCPLPATAGGGPALGPRRIVSLVPAVTETLFAVGAGQQVVGVSSYCNYPPEVKGLPQVGSFVSPAVELVLSLRPDLVLTSPTPGNRNAVDTLRRAGLRVEVVPEGSGSLEETFEMIEKVAVLAGHGAEGKHLVARMRADFDRLANRFAAGPRVKTLVVVGRRPLVVAGPDSYLDDLVKLAGGANAARPLGGKWPRTNIEFVLASAPDVIVDASMAGGATPSSGPWMRYPAIPAVRNGRVYRAADDRLLRPGPRLVEAAEQLGRWLHPKVWAGHAERAD